MKNLKHAVYFFVGFFLGLLISATTFGVSYMMDDAMDEPEMRDE